MDVTPTELACNFLRHSYKDFAPMEYVIFLTFVLFCSIQKSAPTTDLSTARDFKNPRHLSVAVVSYYLSLCGKSL